MPRVLIASWRVPPAGEEKGEERYDGDEAAVPAGKGSFHGERAGQHAHDTGKRLENDGFRCVPNPVDPHTWPCLPCYGECFRDMIPAYSGRSVTAVLYAMGELCLALFFLCCFVFSFLRRKRWSGPIWEYICLMGVRNHGEGLGAANIYIHRAG